MTEFHHVSVLLDECIENLNIKPDGIYVDGTLGGAGHSSVIASKLTTGRLIGIDRDTNALKAAGQRLAPYADRVTLVHSNFSELDRVLEDLGIPGVDGILLDLGVSSPQLDEAEFRSADMELKTIFSPFKIGNVELNHRMVKSAAGSAAYLAGMTDEFLSYYFNLAKGGMNMAATLLLYKPVVTALRKAHLVAPSKSESQNRKLNVGFLLFSLALLATFVMLALVLWGII